MSGARFLFVKSKNFEFVWPFVEARLMERLQKLGRVETVVTPDETWKSRVPIEEMADLSLYDGLVWFGGRLTAASLAKAPKLRMIGCNEDNSGSGLPLDEMERKGLYLIDTTRAWAQSVAECGLALTLCALRQIPHWHHRMMMKEPLWDFKYQQFCDDDRFVSGDLGTKKVGIIGLGQIGRKLAQWCSALGADVCGVDPHVNPEDARKWGARLVDIDTLTDTCNVVMVAIPPVPGAKHMLNAERIGRLKRGTLVMIVTRAWAVDMDALRKRIAADELAGAFDVYDIEPLPVNDVLRGRSNVVHLPHIAGRTIDSNQRVADMIADDFERILRGEKPLAALSPKAAAVRSGKDA